MDRLRLPAFIVALLCMVLVLGAEIAANWLPFLSAAAGAGGGSPGIGIPSLAPLDGLLLFTMLLVAAPYLIGDERTGRVQGCATAIASFLVVLGAIVLAIIDLVLIAVMVSLLLAAPFGTIAYLAIFGHFPTGKAAVMLGALLFLKLLAAVMLVVAQQGFLRNKGLVLIVLTSLVANLVISFLHALVPRPLVSITDGIGGLVAAIIAIIWALILLIFSIPAILKAFKKADSKD